MFNRDISYLFIIFLVRIFNFTNVRNEILISNINVTRGLFSLDIYEYVYRFNTRLKQRSPQTQTCHIIYNPLITNICSTHTCDHRGEHSLRVRVHRRLKKNKIDDPMSRQYFRAASSIQNSSLATFQSIKKQHNLRRIFLFET